MKKRVSIIGVLCAILVLGVGYAAITARYLNITGTATMTADPDNFNVLFEDDADCDNGMSLTLGDEDHPNDPHYATLTVDGLTYAGQSLACDISVKNISKGLKASLDNPIKSVTGDESEYFSIDAAVTDDILNYPETEGADCDDCITNMHISLTASKTPTDTVSANVAIRLKADPLSD